MSIDLAALRGKVSPLIAVARRAAKEAETTIDVLKEVHSLVQSARGHYRPSGYTPSDIKKLAEKVAALPAHKHAKLEIERLKYLASNVCIHERGIEGLHCLNCGSFIDIDAVPIASPSEWKHRVDRLATGLLSERAEKLEKTGILRQKAKEAFQSLRELGVFTAAVDGMERTLEGDAPDVEQYDRKLQWLEPFRELARC
uniref:Uncharacterized protein n=1 Tax=Pseudomonas phage Cygsa01 TaxID=3138529 RepID=A0AAU6W3R5_9VIRU